MKIKLLSVALGIVLSATVLSANAQKRYTEGLLTIKTSGGGYEIEVKEYFRPDSTAALFSAGPANLKLLADANYKFFAVVASVPAANIKKAAIYTPAEIDQVLSSFPTLTFATSTETKQISGFNCKKVVATDTKTKKTYDIWITNDIALPSSVIDKYYAAIGGAPIKYISFQTGPDGVLTAADYVITGVSDQKAPAGTFGIAPDFDKISKAELDAMSRGKQ
ncbi:hypothetical protein IDJ77_20030 [Mucilaginibacter sp. ZT4R22]|uniref:GLPGLI family protein n=1 Tax=Mucilaginibacter pankratovii TaxID=2772110 RepID=A0ABR7WV18_9SPHI|nr:hypothetical protein [Mucilaginibacter pankratovii]MBD1366111.1 hypothetical protein [Mucilaginibacter pankratovii]